MKRAVQRLELPATIRFLLYTAVGVLVWNHRSALMQDLLLVGVFVAALIRNPRGFKIWLRVEGMLFLLAGVLILVHLPTSGVAAESGRELLKYVDVVLAALALPALLPTRKKMEGALFYSAWAITAVLAFDLARLVAAFHWQVLTLGHTAQPFAFGHSNLAAMMGGTAFLTLLCFAWMLWRRRSVALGCVAGALVCLAHFVCMAARGPQVALLATLGLGACVLPVGWRRKGVVGVLAMLAVAALALHIQSINPRFADWSSVRSFAGRDVVWAHTLQLVRQQPWLGYGWGRAVFEQVYHGSHPPASPFHYFHAHEYWLQVAFATGLIGVVLHFVAWTILVIRLLVLLGRASNVGQRLLPALVLFLIAYLHIYGLADWPAGVVGVMMLWLIPVVLVVTGWTTDAER